MGGHGLPWPKGPMNNDPYQWMKGLRDFTKYALKHDPGLWMIVVPTGLGFVYAGAMILKKIGQDPNISIPLPWVDPNRYEGNFDRNVHNWTLPCNVSDEMRQGFKDRYKNHKLPENIE